MTNVRTVKCNSCGHRESFFDEITIWDKKDSVWKRVKRPSYSLCEVCESDSLEEIFYDFGVENDE